MKYDDASWHYEGDFPQGLPFEASATHTGMFLAWALLRGLGSPLHTEELEGDLQTLRRREITPGAYFLKVCDGKFSDTDLNPIGNRFAQDYFDFSTGEYLTDYEETLAEDLDDIYQVADTWENFDLLKPVLDEQFRDWIADQEED
ncbi:hypothetical protein LOC68_03065 [Blastopirellula sp. JC732]|uniref:DUF7832 domain-containing protein n=1 Tax=Blastopirellula sediminis TaxID=2894196 RepID=A0A9X1MJA6_9BACT|nr:hypothetical protein [Blastopirellula sediminis]MCC9607842.1 hypothetical protein [Blastopirellula sediminis]MCC9627365.1 hypothetical protein [Blastopirellula sediminis]